MKWFVLFIFSVGAASLAVASSSQESDLSDKFKAFSQAFTDLTEELGKEIKRQGAALKDKADETIRPKIQEELATIRSKIDELVGQLKEKDKAY